MISVYIKLTTAGSLTGPFNLSTSSNGVTYTSYKVGEPKIKLTSGFVYTDVPNGTTYIKVLSQGSCSVPLILAIAGSSPTPTPTATTPGSSPTPTYTPTPTPTTPGSSPTPTYTPTPTPTATTPGSSPTPTYTPTPTPTPTSTTPGSSPTPTYTPTYTATPTPTATTPGSSPTPTYTPTPTATDTPIPTPTDTPSPTPTATIPCDSYCITYNSNTSEDYSYTNCLGNPDGSSGFAPGESRTITASVAPSQANFTVVSGACGGSPTPTATTPVPTPTDTPAPTPTATSGGDVSDISFGSTGGDLVATNSDAKVYSVTYSYSISASCDNEGTSGGDAVNAVTTLYIGGTEVDTIMASVGSVPGTPQYDTQSKTGSSTVSGLNYFDLSSATVSGQVQCSSGLMGQGGTVSVTISSATVNTGTVNVICDNIWTLDCTGTVKTC